MSFTTDKAKQKLTQVNNTQQSIQSTSQWCLFHYRHANQIVSLWRDAFIHPDSSIDQSESNYRLALFYLCNDIVQFSKKKEDKYAPILSEFNKIMPQILTFVTKDSLSTHLKPKYMRVIDVWKDRLVYPAEIIDTYHSILNSVDSNKPQIQHQPQHKINSKPTLVSLALTHQAEASDYHQINTSISNVPTELVICVEKFNKLNDLYKSYKKNFTDFNKFSNSILADAKNSTGEKETQLNNLLSSLSSLGNGNSTRASDFEPTSAASSTEGSADLSRFIKTEALGSQISDQFKQIAQLRRDLACDFRKIAQELDDWMMLDKSKQSQTEATLKNIKEKKNSIIQENESVSVFNYDNDDEENIPRYDNQDDSDSDSDRGGSSDSDTNNDDEVKDPDIEGGDLLGEETKQTNSLLRKRLLGEDDGDESTETKRSKKSVQFSEQNETLVFDTNETIQVGSETTEAGNKTIDSTNETTEKSDNDLTALLGLLQ